MRSARARRIAATAAGATALAIAAAVASPGIATAAAPAGQAPAPAAAVADPPPEPVLCSTLERGTGGVVPGDVVADVDCLFIAATVLGDITVLPGGGIDLRESTVHGSVRSSGGGSLWIFDTQVDGDVSAVRTSGEAALWNTVVGGSLRIESAFSWIGRTTVAGDVDLLARQWGDVTLFESVIGGTVTASAPEKVQVRDNHVGGSLVTGMGRLISHDNRVDGSLTSTSASDVLVCRTTVGGDLTVTDVQGWSRVGQELPYRCRTTVGGSVHVVDNPHSVVLGDLVVAGDLVCTGNTGPRLVVRGPSLTVAGARTGQCA
jgi:hypothetical protein